MRRIVGVAAAASLFGLALAAPAFAGSGKLKVHPSTYDPEHTGIIVSAWEAHTGLPDAGNSDHGLVLQKNGPTATNAAAVAAVTGAEGEALGEVGFDVKGYCGAGSPRFDVYDQEGAVHFFGCAYGAHTPVPGHPGWTEVRQSGLDAFPPMALTDTISAIYIVADEEGQSVLDNIDVNGMLVGKPGNG